MNTRIEHITRHQSHLGGVTPLRSPKSAEESSSGGDDDDDVDGSSSSSDDEMKISQ